jgi:hypothetical protein
MSDYPLTGTQNNRLSEYLPDNSQTPRGSFVHPNMNKIAFRLDTDKPSYMDTSSHSKSTPALGRLSSPDLGYLISQRPSTSYQGAGSIRSGMSYDMPRSEIPSFKDVQTVGAIH